MKSQTTNVPDLVSPPAGAVPRKTFHAGTLTYTVAGLGGLFFWLLWGDFCFTIMEAVWHSILPLKLKELAAPNWIIGFIMVSLPQVLGTVLGPVISTTSDRFRSPWGRRRPFMLVATPFIAVMLCIFGFSPDIGGWLAGSALGQATGWSQGAITVGVIAFLLLVFRIADLFISLLFWCFFNDVVPSAVLARFMSLVRIVGMLAGASYNYFVYEHALSHMRVIFVAAGLLYFFGFGMMCWRVKEGEYPPPVARPARDRGLLGMVRTYARECLRQRMHILLYLHVMLWALATSVLTFSVFLNLSLGITLKQLGTLSAISGVATAVLAYPAGMLADRFHPVRLMIWMKFGLVILAPLSFVWLFTHFSPSVNFAILVGLYVVAMPLNLMYGAILMPLYNRLFPREQFGQFTSFMGICSAAAMVCGGVVVGLFLDGMRVVFPDALYGKDFCYRLIPAWSLFFLSLSLILLALLYKEWRRKGGEAYEPHPVVVKADATKEIS